MKILNNNKFVYSSNSLGFIAEGTAVDVITYTTDISNRFSIRYGNLYIEFVIYHKTHCIEFCDAKTKREDSICCYFEILE